MKHVWIVLLAALLVLTAVGCKKKAEVVVDLPADGNKAGGWSVADDPTVTEARKAIFDKGMVVSSNEYTAVAYLASQVVAGTNHAFLCRSADPMGYALAFFYEDLKGEVKLMNVTPLGIVPQEDGTAKEPVEGLMGGWSYAQDPAVTDEMKARLTKALEGMVGATYVPVANLGEQVVAGLNRCLLCRLTPVIPNAQSKYALVYVYEDLQGGATLSKVIDLDVGSFCAYGA